MKKNHPNGFVLAETLVVTVFLMTIFSMIYYYFFPLIGEYEKREVYDSVDDKYSAYWIKKIIEDSEYVISTTSKDPKIVEKAKNFKKYGYFRFECRDVPAADEKKQMCKTLVNALQVSSCDKDGNHCDIFVTAYRIGGISNEDVLKNFKKTVALEGSDALVLGQEDCSASKDACKNAYAVTCKSERDYKDAKEEAAVEAECKALAAQKVFSGGLQEYVKLLPDYRFASENGALYRIIVSFQHKTDNNNYYSYATIEVGG